ncbi:hypothetical protein ACS22S_27790, partial [Klebsiella pneumoniae]|uniref:hypothetical protein n=1 Tax=Klebsiella pneumoniae TaxID=573 RepID=UPI003F22EE19
MDADCRAPSRDQGWFLWIFVAKLALGLVVFAWKPWLGLGFLIAYALYVWKELRSAGEIGDAEELEPLKFRPRHDMPHVGWAL